VRGEKKTLRSFKGQRVKEASSLRFFLDKKSHPPAAREATQGEQERKKEKEKKGDFYSQRAALTSSRGHASLFLSSRTKKNVDDDE
jgi:CO dehydrogenase/acetyl-CoA synthase beta subunit